MQFRDKYFSDADINDRRFDTMFKPKTSFCALSEFFMKSASYSTPIKDRVIFPARDPVTNDIGPTITISARIYPRIILCHHKYGKVDREWRYL